MDKIKLLQAAVRRHQVTKIFKKLDKTRKFRDKTIRELVETEEVYVQCLNTLVEVYFYSIIFSFFQPCCHNKKKHSKKTPKWKILIKFFGMGIRGHNDNS